MKRSLHIVIVSILFICNSYGDIKKDTLKTLDFDYLFYSDEFLEPYLKIYNFYSGINSNDKKAKFAKEYLFQAKKNKISNHIDFAIFLTGESNILVDNWDKASDNFHKLLRISENKLIAYTGLINFHQKKKNVDSIKYYLSKSKNLFFNNSDQLTRALYLRRYALFEIENENYLSSLDKLIRITEMPKVDESAIGTASLFTIGWLYEHLNYPEKAKMYFERALFGSLNNGTNNLSHFCKLKLAHINLFNFNRVDKAIEGYKGLESVYEFSDKYQEGILYGTLGFAYLKKGNKKEAFHYMTKSRDHFERKKDSTFLCLPYTYLTHYYVEQEDYIEAIKNGETAIRIIENQDLFEARKLILLDKLAAAYTATNNFKKSNQLLEELNSIKSKLEIKKNIVAFTDNQYEKTIAQEKLKVIELNNSILEKNKLLYLFFLIVLGVVLIFIIILYNNRRKTNDKLRELDATKSRFVANISHEFRTPLTLILNPIEEAVEDKSLPEGKREQFKVAKRNSDRLLTLVNQLLDLSKIDANQLKLNIEKAELVPFIAALADSFSYSAQQKAINYIVDAKRNSIEGYFDKDAIEKIVTNLITNAIKYTPNKGDIKLSCSIVDEQLLFEVNNSGTQLSPEEAKAVFNRFYQTNEDNSGSGIGLALVKELVDLHKGSIAVNITEEDWICFSVKLPVDYNSYKNETFITTTLKDKPSKVETYSDTIEVQEEDIAFGENKPLLLIVEDHADIRNLVNNLFSDTYSILTAPNGEKGTNLAIERVPDIIISDVMMPVKDGIALTQHLKNDERTSHIPIVLLTAKAGDSNELLGIEVGADDYITKPFNSKILVAKVEKLIENRRLLQERYSQELVLLPKDVAITNIDEQFLERLQKVLDINLVEPTFSASSFSEAICMSRMQLHRKLKALTGFTTSEFIRSQRLKLAAELLKQSNTNVSQIGYSVGFNDHAYFSKCFKELYNCTPTEYANKA